MTPEEMAEQFSKFANGATRSQREEFARLVTTDHRTLQQASMDTFLMCIRQWAKASTVGCFDARNEATCGVSAAIVNGLSSENKSYYLFEQGEYLGLPYI